VTAEAGRGPHLIDALGAGSGIVCLAGAGGKKTTMVRLAAVHPGCVALTATTRVPHRLKRDSVDLVSLPADVEVPDAVSLLGNARIAGYAGPRTRNFRLDGMDPATIAGIHGAAGFDATYVKVDGARMRLAKAHKPGEPSLVPGMATVVLLSSIQAVGRAIDEATVHHPELFADIVGARPGDVITVDHLAALVIHQVAALRGMTNAPIVPVVNMADDAALLERAREVAGRVRQGLPDLPRLAITSMIQPEPLKELLTFDQP
jgi:probable selenium-dependent hydroxylase accessory protein YqeC